VNAIGIPCIVKTVREGYDGKGQAAIRSDADVEFAWGMVSSGKPAASLVVEQFAQFRRELSMLGVRSRDGQMRFYPPTENVHVAGILARSTAPAPRCDDRTREAMEQATGKVLERLEYVGVLAVEFFEVGDGIVVANEMAPRVHNSGHWTIEGAECSQFENHIRAVAGLPLGSTAPRGYSIMLNVIGGEPDLRGLLSTSGVHVHMYGKTPRPGRKLGHVTVCETDAVKTSELAVRVAAMLRNC
jgi:5-(carboxyamino)imidazole ribonucleotide synthase